MFTDKTYKPADLTLSHSSIMLGDLFELIKEDVFPMILLNLRVLSCQPRVTET